MTPSEGVKHEQGLLDLNQLESKEYLWPYLLEMVEDMFSDEQLRKDFRDSFIAWLASANYISKKTALKLLNVTYRILEIKQEANNLSSALEDVVNESQLHVSIVVYFYFNVFLPTYTNPHVDEGGS